MQLIKINQNEFVKTLSIAATMAGRDKSRQILDYVKCVLRDGSLTMTSYNMEIAITSKCEVTSDAQDLSFCIEPREFLEYIKLIENQDEIEIELNDEMTSATVTHSNGKTSFTLLPAKDFPVPAHEENKAKITISADVISEWVRNSQRCVSHDGLNPITNSMYLFVDGGSCGYCATDNKKLITESIQLEQERIDNNSALIPASAFDAILTVAKKSCDMSIWFSEKAVIFQCSGSAARCQCTQGRFPNFHSIIPQNSPIVLKGISNSAFYNSVQRISLAKNAKGNPDKAKTVKMTVSPYSIKMEAENLMNGNHSVENIPCKCDANLEIGLNCNFLRDALACVNGDLIDIHLTSPKMPMVIKEDKNEGKVILLIPQILRK